MHAVEHYGSIGLQEPGKGDVGRETGRTGELADINPPDIAWLKLTA